MGPPSDLGARGSLRCGPMSDGLAGAGAGRQGLHAARRGRRAARGRPRRGGGRARRAVRRGRLVLRALDDLARRRGPRGRHGGVRRRPPPRLGGEPARLGVPRPDRRRRAHRQDGHAADLPGRRSTTPGWRTSSSPSSAGRRPSPATGRRPAALVFIDGGHGVEPARADYAGWAPHVAVGGTLAIHDVFPDPADGGRPPYEEIFRAGAGRAAGSRWPRPPARCASSRASTDSAGVLPAAGQTAGHEGTRHRRQPLHRSPPAPRARRAVATTSPS